MTSCVPTMRSLWAATARWSDRSIGLTTCYCRPPAPKSAGSSPHLASSPPLSTLGPWRKSAVPDAEAFLRILQITSLIRLIEDREAGTLRYRLHHFTREYARLRLSEQSESEETRRRFVAHYVKLVKEGRGNAADRNRVEQYKMERRNIVAASDIAEAMTDHEAVMALAEGDFFSNYGFWSEAERLKLRAVASAQATGNGRLLSAMHNDLGKIYLLQGRYNDARVSFQKSLDIWSDQDDLEGRRNKGRTLGNLGVLY